MYKKKGNIKIPWNIQIFILIFIFYFLGFYKKNSEFFGKKKKGKPLVHGGIHIQPNKQGSMKFIEAIKPLYYRTSQNYTHP